MIFDSLKLNVDLVLKQITYLRVHFFFPLFFFLIQKGLQIIYFQNFGPFKFFFFYIENHHRKEISKKGMKSFCSFYENGSLGLVSAETHLGF